MNRCGFIFFILFLSASIAYSQGNTGANDRRPEPTIPSKPNIKPSATNRRQKSKAPKSTIHRATRPNTARPKAITGVIAITVNESGSMVEINRVDKAIVTGMGSRTTIDTNDTLTFKALKPGIYQVKIYKNGFYEEKRTLSLRAGGAAAWSANLRPAIGFVTILSNADGKEIEIKGVGRFSESVQNLGLAPKQYEIAVTAAGYEPFTRTVEVKAGQTMIVDAHLVLASPENLLRSAQNHYQYGRYTEAATICRLILEQDANLAPANLLMGYAYFYSGRPLEGRYYLARAIGLQAMAKIPVKIYQKQKNSEILTEGSLSINENNLSFNSTARPEFNFSVSASSINKVELKQGKRNGSSAKPDLVDISGQVNTGMKTEKKTLRLYGRQAFARVTGPNKAEIAGCSNCTVTGCLCNSEIQAVYELLLNVRDDSFPRGRFAKLPLVAPPSPTFTQFDGQAFSLALPNNWVKVDDSNDQVWFAPTGGVTLSQNRTHFIYALGVGTRPLSSNDLLAETGKFYRAILSSNEYLEQQSEPQEVSISGSRGLTTSFIGFNKVTATEESVQFYTTFTRTGNLFYLMTVTPFEERQEYRSTFRSILRSVKF